MCTLSLPLLASLTLGAPFTTTLVEPAALSNLEEGEERYQFIAGLCEEGHYELAAKEARAFLASHPKHKRAKLARYRLASALFELDRPAEAAPYYRELSKQSAFEYRAETFLRLGQCELLEEKYETAQKALRKAYASKQDYLKPTAAFFLAETEFNLDEFRAAKDHYEECLRSKDATTYHPHAERGLAWSSFRLEDNGACIRAAQRFLKNVAGSELESEVRFLLGDAYSRSNQSQQADTAWRMIKSGDYQAAALRGRAYILSQANDHRGAARMFAELLEADQNGPYAKEAAVQCGAHLLRAGAPEDALIVLTLKAAGNEPETLYWRSQALAQTGEEERALQTLQTASRAADSELQARIAAMRGDLLYKLGRLDEAADAYGGDNSDYSLHAAATAQLNAGKTTEALESAERMLRDFPESPYSESTHAVRAEALFQLERYTPALAAFEKLAGPRAAERKAWCHYYLDEWRAAASSFAAVGERFPQAEEADQARFMEGRSYQEAGDNQHAVATWNAYLREHPTGHHSSEVRLQLARLGAGNDHLSALLRESPTDPLAAVAMFELAESYVQEGNRDLAIATYKSYLQRFPGDRSSGDGRYGLAWSLRSDGQNHEALEQLILLIELKPEEELRIAATEMALWCAADLDDAKQAQHFWQQLAGLSKDEAQIFAAAQVASRCLQRVGKSDQASRLLSSLRKKLRSEEIQLSVLIEESWIQIDAGEALAARNLLAKAIAIAPRDSRVQEAAFFTGESFFEAEEFAEASKLYAAAAQKENAELFDDALYKLGFALLSSGKHDQAADAFESVVQSEPESVLWGESLFLAGECRYRAGNLEACVELLKRFRKEVRPHAVRAKALFRLGLAAGATSDPKTAEAALTELLKSSPDFENRIQAQLEQGRAYVQLAKPRAARASFDSVLAMAQGSKQNALFAARARIEIGRLHFAARAHEDALSEFLKVSLLYAAGEEVHEARLLAGLCLEAQGERDLAIQQYRKLTSGAPDSQQGRAANERLRAMKAD
ncbi:MAG: TolA-binding protein [Planctomycetota bacterium]|jgi:TolA-binding protein